jgi:hypothetical protein
MDIVTFAQAMYKSLADREETISLYLANGSAQDYETYRNLVGVLQGLRFAKDEMKALLEKSEEDVEHLLKN